MAVPAAATSDDQDGTAGDREAAPMQPADEAGAIKVLTKKPTIGQAADALTAPMRRARGPEFVDEPQDVDLVRTVRTSPSRLATVHNPLNAVSRPAGGTRTERARRVHCGGGTRH